MTDYEEVAFNDLFSLGEDETVTVRAADLQRFLRLMMLDYPSPALTLVRGGQGQEENNDPELVCRVEFTRDDIAEHWLIRDGGLPPRGEAVTEAYIDEVIRRLGEDSVYTGDLAEALSEAGFDMIGEELPDVAGFMREWAENKEKETEQSRGPSRDSAVTIASAAKESVDAAGALDARGGARPASEQAR